MPPLLSSGFATSFGTDRPASCLTHGAKNTIGALKLRLQLRQPLLAEFVDDRTEDFDPLGEVYEFLLRHFEMLGVLRFHIKARKIALCCAPIEFGQRESRGKPGAPVSVAGPKLSAVQSILDRFSRRERELLRRSDLDRLARGRIASVASRRVLDLEFAETVQGNFLALRCSFSDGRKYGINGLAGLDFRGARFGSKLFGKISVVHSISPVSLTVCLAVMVYIRACSSASFSSQSSLTILPRISIRSERYANSSSVIRKCSECLAFT